MVGFIGESREVFVLDMEKSVNVAELADELVNLSRYTLGRDLVIVCTRIRPGRGCLRRS